MNAKCQDSSFTGSAHANPPCAHAVLMQNSSCSPFFVAHSWFVSWPITDTWHQWLCQFSYVLFSSSIWCIWMHRSSNILMNSCIYCKLLCHSYQNLMFSIVNPMDWDDFSCPNLMFSIANPMDWTDFSYQTLMIPIVNPMVWAHVLSQIPWNPLKM